MKKRMLGLVLVFAMLLAGMAGTVSAEPSLPSRTVLVYICGSNLESQAGLATYNIRQILEARYSGSGGVKVVVMTGGAEEWKTESSLLSIDPALLPQGESISRISGKYNQVWEAMGADAPCDAGKLVLRDGDGITKDTPVLAKDELMSDPETLKAFIDYGVREYPAEKYDLVLWDHGSGPSGGFGVDEHDPSAGPPDVMDFAELMDAFSHNELTAPTDGRPPERFDFVNFDACLMSSAEIALLMADYADYYVASPELEPGFGQFYTGWLDELGRDPDADTFELGKKIVDDFIDFYTEGAGTVYKDEGTLAVTDLQKLKESGLTAALRDLAAIMKAEAGLDLFYDEMAAARGSIQYGDEASFDLGNLASLISIVYSEVTEEQLDDGDFGNLHNTYFDESITERILGVLQDDEIMYAAGTDGIVSKDQYYRTAGGDTEHGDLKTSGMHIFFPDPANPWKAADYLDALKKVLDGTDDPADPRCRFLEEYRQAMIDYILIDFTGMNVSEMINDAGIRKDAVNYDSLKEYCMEGETDPDKYEITRWGGAIEPVLKMREGGEAGAREWLDGLIRQQADEAVDSRNVTAAELKQKNGVGYRITVGDAKKRVVAEVDREVRIELPALEDYMKKYIDAEGREVLEGYMKTSLGSFRGELDMGELAFRGMTRDDMIRWFHEKESIWNLEAPEEKWYAVKDAAGGYHAAAIDSEDDDSCEVLGTLGKPGSDQVVRLEFSKEDGSLTKVGFDTAGGIRYVSPTELTKSYSVMSANYVDYLGIREFFLPLSETTFELSKETAGDISLAYEDIRNLSDIADVDGDGKVFANRFTVTDIYSAKSDVTDIVQKTEERKIDIRLARIRPSLYTGEKRSPEVVYRDKTLTEGVDYTWKPFYYPEWEDEPDLIETGVYDIVLEGQGGYAGICLREFRIILDEITAEASVEEAEGLVQAAVKAVGDAIASQDADALEEAYAALVTAQNALVKAREELDRTRAAIAIDELEQLEAKIDELEDKVEEISAELAEAKVIDISNYRASHKTKLVYNGNYRYPAVRVAGLKKADYWVGYSRNRNVGTAKAVVRPTGQFYKGTIALTFRIVPKKGVVKTIKAGTRRLTVTAKLKPAKTGGKYYEVRYRAKGASKWRKAKMKGRVLTLKKLKKGKVYSVKIRAAKKVNGKRYYGAWSKVRTTKKIK